MIAIGSGGIKPCVSAFGGDQFQLPAQATQVAKFFTIYYFTLSAGSLLSTLITPSLRQDVYCFDDEDCYSLAFGVPCVLMIVSISKFIRLRHHFYDEETILNLHPLLFTALFICGKPLYKLNPPAGNMVTRVTKCIKVSILLYENRDIGIDFLFFFPISDRMLS